MYKFTSRFSEGKGLVPPSLKQIKDYKPPNNQLYNNNYTYISNNFNESSKVHTSLATVLPVLWPTPLEEEASYSQDKKDELQSIVEPNSSVMTSFASMSSSMMISLLKYRKHKLDHCFLNTHVPRVMKFIGRSVYAETQDQVTKNGLLPDGSTVIRCDNPVLHIDYKELLNSCETKKFKSVVPTMTAMVFRAVTSLTNALRTITQLDVIVTGSLKWMSARKELLTYLEQVRKNECPEV
jgi:hypothetical protein